VPRIAPLEEAEWTDVERALLKPIQDERGAVPNIYRMFARHPEMFTPRYEFGRYLQRESTVPSRERELLINRIAWLSNCEYEWSAHTRIGRENGLTDQEIDWLRQGPAAPGWSAEDRTLMLAVEQLYDQQFLEDEVWSALAARFEMHQMMDLVVTVGGYHMLATALNSFGVELEPGAEGFPERPAGLAAAGAGPRGEPGTPTRLAEPRIAPLDESQWTDFEREVLAPRKVERGRVLHVYGTMARHPAMYRKWIAFAGQVLRRSSLAARERELLINRIAWLASGEYEWAAHNDLGRQAGLSDEELLRIAAGPEAEGWSEADRTLLRAVDELHRDAFLGDATWSALRPVYDDRQMIDLVLTVGAYKMLAMALNSFGAQLEDDMVGFPPAP
jgi:alkylhydroperoxidase family enzyme